MELFDLHGDDRYDGNTTEDLQQNVADVGMKKSMEQRWLPPEGLGLSAGNTFSRCTGQVKQSRAEVTFYVGDR